MRVVECPVCGQMFMLAPCNIYKVTIKGKVKHLCSYSCMRKLEREKEAKKTPKEVKQDADR